MAENVLHVRGRKAEILRIIRHLPAACAGDVGEVATAARALLVRIGMAALAKIRDAFVVKSHGGTDEAGERWVPLKPSTIAYGRRHPGAPVRVRQSPSRRAALSPSAMLTAKQRARWWALYRSFAGTAPQGAAFHAAGVSRGWAAARAWMILKNEGAKTIIGEYGGMQVDILRDTGLLLNSLSPGVATDYESVPQVENQVFRPGRGEVIIGTNRKWAAAHHQGVPGRLSQRRLWPEPKDWPAGWWGNILDQARQGLIEITQFLLERRLAS